MRGRKETKSIMGCKEWEDEGWKNEKRKVQGMGRANRRMGWRKEIKWRYGEK